MRDPVRDTLLAALEGLLAFCPADTEKQDRAVMAARRAAALARKEKAGLGVDTLPGRG